jgi:glutathione S-transferase
VNIFESGGIFYYLINRYDTEHKISFPRGSREDLEMWNWVFFQNAGLGPMQGQANHFGRYAPEKIQYGIDRYVNETKRLYRVLDTHLASSKSGFIVGDHISAADITTFGWAAWTVYANVDISDLEHVQKWLKMMEARPAVDKGRDVPTGDSLKKHKGDTKWIEQQAKEGSAWIQKGMKEDAGK